MKLKDLKEGGYYFATQVGWNNWYIRITSIEGSCINIDCSFTDDGDYYGGNSAWANDYGKWNYRELSQQEKEWMDECFKQNKYVKLEDLLINKKQTNMTTKAINITTARKWPTKDLVNGQKFQTKQGEICIHKKDNGSVYILSNIPQLNGTKLRPMPTGWKYSYYAATSSDTFTNLTCVGRLTAFKQQVEEVTKTMRFTGDFAVAGISSLLKAIVEEAVEIGWKFSGEITKSTKGLNFDEGTITTYSGNWPDYNLAEDWEVVLEHIKEQEEVDNVEYVEFTEDGYTSEGFTKGRIYKRDITSVYDDEYDYAVEEDDLGDSSGWTKNDFKPSTKGAFDGQGPNILSVGGFKINIKEVKINGYDPMQMVCIGCQESQQVYSLGALKALYEAMCDDEATFSEEGVTFTKAQVSALIDKIESM